MKLKILDIIDRGATFTVLVKDEKGDLHDVGLPARLKNDEKGIMEELKKLLGEKLNPKKDTKWTEKFAGKQFDI